MNFSSKPQNIQDILIVDDTPSDLKMLMNILRSEGYQVRPASDGELALRSVRVRVPELILLDIGMPNLDGYEVCQRLKDNIESQNIPVIFISALTEPLNKLKAFNVGGVDYITKPFEASEVLSRVQKHIEIRLMQQQLEEQNIQLHQANTRLQELGKMKSMFIASMSHELRTPLNAVLGFSHLMQNSPNISGEEQETLRIIHRSGQHLLSLINAIIDMSETKGGQVKLKPTSFELGVLVHNVIDIIRERTVGKDVHLLLEQSSHCPHDIYADAGKLRQILINLLNNAVYHTLEGHVILRLGVEPPASKQETQLKLRFEVEDSGMGIAPVDQLDIFQPFVQVGELGKRTGTGMGLTITKLYVELMGGEIKLQSELGKGSIFCVVLPVQKVDEGERERVEASSDKGRVVRLAPGQPRWSILIVDDELENRLLLKKLLEPVGFVVREAANGEEAIKKFKEGQPHLILMKPCMPVMDGLEATRRIKIMEGGAETVIVALTAKMFEIQQDGFTCKPFSFDAIFDCLSKHLGVHYCYESVAGEFVDRSIKVSVEAVASLPKEMVERLRDGALSLSNEAFDSALQPVYRIDPTIAEGLAELARTFRFEQILELMPIRPNKRVE